MTKHRRLRRRGLAGPIFSLRAHLASRTPAQALVETALVTPLLMVLLAGVADVGRAFYYKIAVTNAAREAAHWATIQFGSPPSRPTDSNILNQVSSPSQESYGINLSNAPDNVRHSTPPLTASSIIAAASGTLNKGSSWLFIYPDYSGRTSYLDEQLPPGMHWRETALSTHTVFAPDPAHGGVQTVLNQALGGLRPMDANASSACHTFGNPATTNGTYSYTVGPSTPFSFTFLADVTSAGSGSAPNGAQVQLLPPTGVSLTQSWSPSASGNTGLGSLTFVNNGGLSSSSFGSFTLNSTTAAGTYAFTLWAYDTCGSGGQAATHTSVTVIVQGASPSPSPSPSPSAAATATPSPSASIVLPGSSATPAAGNGPTAKQITCTVIYYFEPVTPGFWVFSSNGAVYIVGTATLEATY